MIRTVTFMMLYFFKSSLRICLLIFRERRKRVRMGGEKREKGGRGWGEDACLGIKPTI